MATWTENRLWYRLIQVTFGLPGEIGVKVTGLRVQFRVQKRAGKEPNDATVTIYNLAEKSREIARAREAMVKIEAGYEGSGLALLYSGDITGAKHERQGTEWVSTITGGDSANLLKTARFAKSYAPGVGVDSIVNDLVSTITGTVEKAKGIVQTSRQKLEQGYSFGGLVRDALADLEKTLEGSTGKALRFNFDDGVVSVTEDATALFTEAVVLSPTSGLLGSPAALETESGKPARWRVQALLNPKIQPGRILRVVSAALSADLIVDTATHSGDTHGQEWYTDAECRVADQ